MEYAIGFLIVFIIGILIWKIKKGKKYIGVFLSVITIIVCGWLVVSRIDFLDIPSNKNDQYAMFEKTQIMAREDIGNCEKQLLINKVEDRRARTKYFL